MTARPWMGLVFAAALFSPAVYSAASSAASGIAWQWASSDAEVDKAFAQAKKSGKPVYLYWGAVWCPPCNQVKATLFSRADFVERSKAFVPVYVDGDKPGAQKVASRFKVSGYPTMIVFKPDGTEITRLPGEVDPERYLLTLTTGLNAQTPVKELVQKALSKQTLTPEQWRLLAYYSWDTDQQQILTNKDLPAKLAELAAHAPADLPMVRDRLAFKSLAASAKDEGTPDAASIERGKQLTARVLASHEASKQLAELLVGYGESIVKYLAPAGDARRTLAMQWDASLAKLLEGDMTKGDRVDTFDARVSMWKMIDGTDTLSAERRKTVLAEIAKLVAATTDKYERQAVVPSAAHVLAAAGMLDQSDELLKFELPKAVSPYYHMLGLAGNAKKRNDSKGALAWYEQAWKKSEGPATRIQWGTNYVGNIVDLSPTDVARVESAATAIISQLQPSADTFYERNQRSLQRMAGRLMKWQGNDPSRVTAVNNVKAKLAKTCAKLPASDTGRSNCDAVFTPAS